METWLRPLVVAASGILLWEIASFAAQTAEPWDSPGFWYAYLLALCLSAAWGFVFPRIAWAWGLIVIYAQAPVMWWHSGVGSLWALGLVLLGIIALPAVGAATAGARFARSRAA